MKNAAPRPGHETVPRCFSVIFRDLTAFQSLENAPHSVAAPVCLG
jgi:hypothetical protein